MAVSVLAQVARADEVYTFTGSKFIFYDFGQGPCPPAPPPHLPCPPTAQITGSFVTDLPLSQLENLTNFIFPVSDIVSFNFTDNYSLDINQTNAFSDKDFIEIS